MRGGHVSVIVGGSQGIGRALGVALARRGGSVLAVGRHGERLAATLAELREAGPAGKHSAERFDVAIPGDMAGLAGLCKSEYGHVDLLVVSAAVAGYESEEGRLPPATRDLPLAAWQRAIDVNLHGVFLADRAFLPMMLARGAGDILNICSALTRHGQRGQALAPGYSASKFAVAAFTRALAAETAESGVRVNALFPGTVDTQLIAGTVLDKAFGGKIAAENFAAAVIELLEATEGSVLPDPHILPMPADRRSMEARRPPQ
jgi:NAD(P)-dependent dehydrogenase (short-subunit alcohol dehydrogenase family)